MKWISFHHPDWSLPVVRRRVGEELLELIDGTEALLLSGGRAVLWNSLYTNRANFNNALYRLKGAGLIVKASRGTKLPLLKVTASGKRRLPVYFRPEKEWNRKWNGLWYVLVFDVPEKERAYRDSLRRFLKTLRMGCLQKSVWITPRDIRPEYDDLEKAANVCAVSYLLESRTVLHREAAELVRDAWDFSLLYGLQSRYLNVFSENLRLARDRACEPEELMTLLRRESEAYIQCMQTDPLLPNPLLPEGYLGKEVVALRKNIRRSVVDMMI